MAWPRILIFLIAIMVSQNTYSQIDEPDYVDTTRSEASSFWDKVYLGGNIGAQFGSVLFIDLSPNIGYYLTKNRKLSAGVGVTYQYLNVRSRSHEYDTHTFGGRVFGRYIIWKGITTQVEAEMLSVECFRQYYGLQRKGVPALLLGGGYTQNIGGRGGISILVFYNFLQSDCSPYRSPIIRLGFNIGL